VDVSTCQICDRPILARGLCRMHYERNRKWGDPHRSNPPGTRRSVPDELAAAGISARMRNHWAALGVIGLEQDPISGRYLWTADDIAVALLVKRLVDAGLPLAMAGTVAQLKVRRGRSRMPVADGVYVSVDPAR
jgi:hypothetical protein